ncbi:membrane-associated protein, putative [Bodo saltans]|uniref:Membrane-associated protein, putative n=1 Tax=Bodo saltans TaxID=75058 RepID=A0A0S4J839_BODSA|nr:membrane-associated protein, putative [Bodo saltans]|eukprot:CUG87597.1 membrane-associated protein, putative [Bodo saltans]
MKQVHNCVSTRRRRGLVAMTGAAMLLFIIVMFAEEVLSPFAWMPTSSSSSSLASAPSTPLVVVPPSAADVEAAGGTIASIGGKLGGWYAPAAVSKVSKKQQLPTTRTTKQKAEKSPLRCTTDWEGPPRNESYFWEDPGKDRYTTSGCPLLQKKIRCTGERHRALVLYMIQTKDNPHDVQQEMWNLNHFIRFGVYGAHESTAMFERVDYVFTRMRPSASAVTSVQLCGQKANIKMMWVPDGPCDLCAHGRVIDLLGGAEKVMKKYQFLLMSNAGSRGPLQHQDAPQWIDIFAMGGQTSWTEHTPPLMVGPSIKPYPIHAESHVIGISTKLLLKHMHFLRVHCKGTKLQCITNGEHRAGPAWMLNGGWIHGLSRNITIRNHTLEAKPYQLLNNKYKVRQPLREFYDVCAAMFAKHGGSFMNSTMLKDRTAAHTAQLTMHQSPQRQLGGGDTFRNLLGVCDLLEL